MAPRIHRASRSEFAIVTLSPEEMRLLQVALALVVTGCSSDPSGARVTTNRCISGWSGLQAEADTSSWPTPVSFEPTSGFVLTDDQLVGLDLQSGRVQVATRALLEPVNLGRTGQGPGEFLPYAHSEALRAFPIQWIDAQGDSILVFDGQQLHFWNLQTGRWSRSWSLPPTFRATMARISRVHWDSIGVIILVERPPAGTDNEAGGVVEVMLIDGTGARKVAAFETLPWARNAAGTPTRGLAEAAPSWDIQDRCLVLADGHTNRFIVMDLRTSEIDTVVVALPDRFQSDDPERYRALGIPESHLSTRFPARVRAVTLDLRGTVWVLPAAPSPRGERWRVNLATNTIRIDTSLVFPQRFDNKNRGLATVSDSNGVRSFILIGLNE